MNQLLEELRSRGTIRTAAVYAAAAWLITEVSATVFPALYFPDWSVTAIVVLVILGFPLTMVLSWVFDFGPTGIQRAAPLTAGHKVTIVLAGTLLAVTTALLVAVIYPGGERATPPAPGYEPLENSIAVLPFTDMSRARDHEYLADGLADTLLHRLAQVAELTVIARTSSFAFRDKKSDIREIGRQLNVGAVLEGSVQRAGETVRIIAQLIDANTGTHLWSRTFDRPARDIFAIQDEIAEAVTNALVGELVQPGASGAARGQTTNFDAYDLYLLGRHRWHQRTPDSLDQAISYFKQAIEVDPNYALSYTGLADAYEGLSWYANQDWQVYLDQAEPLLGKALLLDEQLPEVHGSLGNYYRVKGDYAKSEAAYLRAIALNPNNAVVHMWYAMTLRGVGRYTESLNSASKAMTLDPLSFKVNDHVAYSLFLLGSFDESIEQYRRSVELAPDHPDAYHRIGQVRAATGRLDEGVAWLMEAVARDAGRLEFARVLSYLYLDLDDVAGARRWLPTVKEAPGPLWLLRLRCAILIADDEFGVNRELLRERLEQEPGDPWVRRLLGLAELLSGDPMASRKYFEAAGVQAPDGDSPIFDEETAWQAFRNAIYLANAYQQTGDAQRATTLLLDSRESLVRLRKEGFALPVIDYLAASIDALEGDHQAALVSLQRAIDRGWRHYSWTVRDPNLAALQGNPRFGQMMQDLQLDIERMRKRVHTATESGNWESLRRLSSRDTVKERVAKRVAGTGAGH